MSAARLWVTLFALLSFTLQAYVTQVHVHGASAISKSVADKQQPGKIPASDDPGNCPICQVMLHAGHYVTPSAAALAPLAFTIYGTPVAIDVATIVQTVSHSWNSRAPPRL